MTKPKAKKSATKKTKGLASVAEHAPVTKAAAALNGDRPKGSRNTKAPSEKVERRKLKMKLQVAISPEIIILRGDELAKACAYQKALRLEKSAALADFRSRTNHINERVDELQRAYNEGSESHEVDCIEVLNVKAKTVEIWRTDCDALVSSRPATGDDMQTRVFDKIDKAAPKEEPAPEAKEDSPLLGALFDEEIATVDAKNAEAGEAH